MTQRSSAAVVDLSVIVVDYNTCPLLDEFFEALSSASPQLFAQILFVDNASKDASRNIVRSKYPAVPVTVNEVNVGYGRANNQAGPLVRGRYALLLNTDALVAPCTLTKTVAWMNSHPDCGVLGVKLTDGAGALQPSCRYFPKPSNRFLARTGLLRLFSWVQPVDNVAWDHAAVGECDWVPGCYYLICGEVYVQVSLFDTRCFMYYEEVDHCRRVKEAGWRVLYYPDTSGVHLAGESAKSAGVLSKAPHTSTLQVESELFYMRKHHGRMGLVFRMALLGLGDGIVGLKQILKRLLGPAAASQGQALFSPTWRILKTTTWATQATL